MNRAAEFALAGIAALGLHLAGFAALGGSVPAGVKSAGAGGTALVSVAPSDATLADLIDRWERPPSLTAPDTPMTPQAPDPAPQIAQPPQTLPDLAPVPDLPPIIAETPPSVLAPPEPPPMSLPDPEPAVKAQTAEVAPEAAPKPAPDPKPTPAPKAAPAEAAPAQAGQVAEGTGNRGAAGNDGTAQAATQSDAQTADLRAGWGADIRARIERRKAYPRDGDGASGTVKLRLTVGTDGRLAAVQIVASSGSDALDAAAIKAVQRAGRLPKAPRGLEAGQVTFTLPISFKP